MSLHSRGVERQHINGLLRITGKSAAIQRSLCQRCFVASLWLLPIR